MRNISLKGKITIINSLLCPMIIYPATILGIPNKYLNEINDIFYDFLWGKKEA